MRKKPPASNPITDTPSPLASWLDAAKGGKSIDQRLQEKIREEGDDLSIMNLMLLKKLELDVWKVELAVQASATPVKGKRTTIRRNADGSVESEAFEFGSLDDFTEAELREEEARLDEELGIIGQPASD